MFKIVLHVINSLKYNFKDTLSKFYKIYSFKEKVQNTLVKTKTLSKNGDYQFPTYDLILRIYSFLFLDTYNINQFN